MANPRQFDADDMLIRPGMYFNPQTDVVVIVDDSPLDTEIFNMEDFEGADWVLVSDDVPVDESARDEILETFQATHHGGDGRAVPDEDFEDDVEDEDEDENGFDGEDEDGYDEDE